MRYALKKRVIGFLVLALMVPQGTWAAAVILQAVSGSGSNNRWMDMADNLYSSTYQGSFAYVQPLVSITYNNASGTFSGTLTATGLKPGFAYQMKLVGNSGMDAWCNEQIGYPVCLRRMENLTWQMSCLLRARRWDWPASDPSW